MSKPAIAKQSPESLAKGSKYKEQWGYSLAVQEINERLDNLINDLKEEV